MLLINGKVLIHNGEGLNFVKADIRINSSTIKELGEKLTPLPDEECIDLNGDYVLPGMVNSHYHSYTNILKGTSFGEPLEMWSLDTVALGRILGEREMALSVSLGICDMLRSGVTACLDHIPHLATSHIAAKTYKNTGFKSAIAPMLHNVSDREILYEINEIYPVNGKHNKFPSVKDYVDYYIDFINRFHDPKGNVKVILGINSPQRANDELMKAASELACRFNLSIHCHLLETRWQRLSADNDISPLFKLDKFGLLKEQTSLAHCIWMNEDELDLIAERKAAVVSNPTSNAFLGSGIFPLKQYIKRNIKITLGSDGVNCGTSNNMMDILRFLLLLQRTQEMDYTQWISIEKGLQMITKNGFDVLGFDKPFGEIKPNHSADLAIIDKNSFLDILDDSFLNQMVFNASISAKHVLIDGRFVMKDGKISVIDEEGLRREISAIKPYLGKNMRKALNIANEEKKIYKSVYESLLISPSNIQ